MAPYVYWFLLALILIALEMMTGTFYLLVLGIALGIGGCAALFGLNQPWQFTLSAVAGIVGTIILRRVRRARIAATPHQSLDIGQPVQAVHWRDDGTARAQYRGSEWDAESEVANMPRDVPLYIKAMRGSTLILTHHKPQS
jgi:membrane protein implicated in regulation of membrane protease activity